MESSMTAALRKSAQMTLPGFDNATSSPGSGDGVTRSVLPDGPTTDPSGQAHVHVSLSALPGKDSASRTPATCGPSSSALSPSAALQVSLESRLRMQLTGSAWFTVTWKPWVTPWGRCLSRPRALARSTSGIGFGSLPTPSGTSNHGKNHVAGRLDEWGGSSNPFRGTPLGKVHCPAFEFWLMGYPDGWMLAMPPAMPSSRKLRPSS